MTEGRQGLEAALQSLAKGSAEENDRIIALIRDHTGAEENAIRWEIHALRLFSVESGMDLGPGDRPSDRLLAALYGPLVRSARDDSDARASQDFATLRSRAEMYRGVLQANEQSVSSAQELIEQVGRQFATLCKSEDPRVAHAGGELFVKVAKQAKHITEAHSRYGLH
jgi:hypothetical protein